MVPPGPQSRGGSASPHVRRPQAIELLSGHPDSDEFIEEYRRWRATQPDVVEALIRTGVAYHLGHGKGQPPN
jgi:hypothetical protein